MIVLPLTSTGGAIIIPRFFTSYLQYLTQRVTNFEYLDIKSIFAINKNNIKILYNYNILPSLSKIITTEIKMHRPSEKYFQTACAFLFLFTAS
jgi:hypothetical protein